MDNLLTIQKIFQNLFDIFQMKSIVQFYNNKTVFAIKTLLLQVNSSVKQKALNGQSTYPVSSVKQLLIDKCHRILTSLF